MLKMVEMDENVTLAAQLGGQNDGGRSVILINKFNVKSDDVSKAEARLHIHPTSSWDWGKLCVYQLCSMGVCRPL
jgi:hypothetical protein